VKNQFRESPLLIPNLQYQYVFQKLPRVLWSADDIWGRLPLLRSTALEVSDTTPPADTPLPALAASLLSSDCSKHLGAEDTDAPCPGGFSACSVHNCDCQDFHSYRVSVVAGFRDFSS
jgi:hypothetical protein